MPSMKTSHWRSLAVGADGCGSDVGAGAVEPGGAELSLGADPVTAGARSARSVTTPAPEAHAAASRSALVSPAALLLDMRRMVREPAAEGSAAAHPERRAARRRDDRADLA